MARRRSSPRRPGLHREAGAGEGRRNAVPAAAAPRGACECRPPPRHESGGGRRRRAIRPPLRHEDQRVGVVALSRRPSRSRSEGRVSPSCSGRRRATRSGGAPAAAVPRHESGGGRRRRAVLSPLRHKEQGEGVAASSRSEGRVSPRCRRVPGAGGGVALRRPGLYRNAGAREGVATLFWSPTESPHSHGLCREAGAGGGRRHAVQGDSVATPSRPPPVTTPRGRERRNITRRTPASSSSTTIPRRSFCVTTTPMRISAGRRSWQRRMSVGRRCGGRSSCPRRRSVATTSSGWPAFSPRLQHRPPRREEPRQDDWADTHTHVFSVTLLFDKEL